MEDWQTDTMARKSWRIVLSCMMMILSKIEETKLGWFGHILLMKQNTFCSVIQKGAPGSELKNWPKKEKMDEEI